MTTAAAAPADTGDRCPAAISSHAVGRDDRCARRYRAVEARVAARGRVLTSETIGPWGRTFGQHAANQRRQRRARTSDPWQRDEGVLPINGQPPERWRAGDPHGHGRAIRVPRRRTTAAATPCGRTLLKRGRSGPRG